MWFLSLDRLALRSLLAGKREPSTLWLKKWDNLLLQQIFEKLQLLCRICCCASAPSLATSHKIQAVHTQTRACVHSRTHTSTQNKGGGWSFTICIGPVCGSVNVGALINIKRSSSHKQIRYKWPSVFFSISTPTNKRLGFNIPRFEGCLTFSLFSGTVDAFREIYFFHFV